MRINFHLTDRIRGHSILRDHILYLLIFAPLSVLLPTISGALLYFPLSVSQINQAVIKAHAVISIGNMTIPDMGGIIGTTNMKMSITDIADPMFMNNL